MSQHNSIVPDEISQSEESHLGQYCQMICILLEQIQFQCFNLSSIFFLGGGPMSLNITCLDSVGTDKISQSEESHQEQYCQMLYILPEQTQFVLTGLVWSVLTRMRPLKVRGLILISTVRLLEQTQCQCINVVFFKLNVLTQLVWSVLPRMRSLKGVSSVSILSHILHFT